MSDHTENRTATLTSQPDTSATLLPSDLDTAPRGRYELLHDHARGGAGRVMRAYDPRLRRTVAVKESLRSTDQARARFVREAQLTARLQHPGIVPVHELARWPDGQPFYAMKMVSGRSLKALLAEKSGLAARLELLPNVIAVAETIAYAHSERVIHRDLKPGNIMIGAFGETVVIDWGLAKNLGEPDVAPASLGPWRDAGETGESATATGMVLGTPAYMPPEQARGETVDERADVYALGAILYELL